MAYDQHTADRIHHMLSQKKLDFFTKKMFAGLVFMVNDKMFCGVHFSKKKNTDLLMARIGDLAAEKAIKKEGCHPMDFTGRPMKNFVFVTPDGYDMEDDLEYYIDLCLAFNPLAKSSPSKKKKSSKK